MAKCPQTWDGEHVWVTEWPEDYPGLSVHERTHCDECGAPAPEVDEDDRY